MEIHLRRLRMLREVVDHGGVTAAAEATRTSPSGVSQQMATLERDVGAPVLERRGRSVVLTTVGRVLLEHAEMLFEAERAALAATEDARHNFAVELRVGVFSTVAAGLMPQINQDLRERHPQITLRSREVDPDEALLDLSHGHLDLSFLIDYPDATEPWPPSITIVPLTRDAMHVAAPRGMFTQRKLSLADLAEQDWVISGPRSYYGRAVAAACRAAGFEIRVAHQVDEQATALAMVAAGMGVTLMSDLGRTFLPTSGADIISLAQPLRRHILLGHDTAAAARPATQAFLAAARRAARALKTPTAMSAPKI